MKYLLSILTILLTLSAFSQSYRRVVSQVSQESLVTFPLDTITTGENGMRIVTYSNGTWKYLVEDADKMQLFNELNDHWDTTSIFAYKDIELKDLPSEIELEIIKELDEYHPPIVGGRVSSKYGIRRGRNHNGIDIAAPQGTPLYATFDGRIRFANFHTGGFGYLIIVRNVNGLESWYAHLCRLNVSQGDFVKRGQIIGYVGNTGRSYGSHLHYELRYKDQNFDPDFLIDFTTGSLRYTTFSLEKSFFNIYSRASQVLDNEAEDLIASSELFANATDEEAVKKAADASASYTPSTALYHTIRSGDTLGAIAIKYGTTVTSICKLNNISKTTVLRLGRRLRIR